MLSDQDNSVDWFDVDDVSYALHEKPGAPDSMKVTHHCGIYKVNEWICLDHGGYASKRARHWISTRLPNVPAEFMPEDISELMHIANDLEKPLIVFLHRTFLQSISK